MKYIAAFSLAFALGFGVTSCAKAPPNITPQAVIAFHGSQVIHVLDEIRDAADKAHHTTPPLIDARTQLKIVGWHQDAITIVRATPNGWKATVLDGLVTLKANLSAHDWQVIAPYVALAEILLKEL